MYSWINNYLFKKPIGLCNGPIKLLGLLKWKRNLRQDLHRDDRKPNIHWSAASQKPEELKLRDPAMDKSSLVSDFLSFLNASPTAFHAVGIVNHHPSLFLLRTIDFPLLIQF